MPLLAGVIAEIYLSRPEEGGRRVSMASGHIGQVLFPGGREKDGLYTILNGIPLFPGKSTKVEIRFMAPEALPEVRAGAVFKMRERGQTVGAGRVLEVLREGDTRMMARGA
ncbi:MAG: hypothetical protein M5U26_25690 [Planctomycetota bacterium]|nr:hypothetical protein [Planctomycetota bacterium]